MQQIEDAEETRTCDLYQASVLKTAGCKLKRHEVDKGRIYFYFENHGGTLPQRIIQDYLSHNLEVDALSLVDNVRALKSLCAEVLNVSKGPRPRG
jgi:hypothetical protein